MIKARLLDEKALQEHLLEAQRLNKKLGIYLVQQGILKADQIVKALSQQLHLEAVNLKTLVIDKAVVERVPVKIASYYQFMPVSLEGQKLTVAVYEPLEIHSQDDIRAYLGFETRFVITTPLDIEEALKKYYGLASDTIDQILTKDPQKRGHYDRSSNSPIEDIERQSEDPSVTKLVNQIILEAYQKRATDIHIEPYRNKVRFRYRIDGVLIDANLPPEAKHFLAAILSRIKIMANLIITEKRLPQDGSAVVRTKDQTLDLRVSTIPTPHGESMVIRILPTTTTLLNLEKLGFNTDNAKKFRDLIRSPHGVLFVTGPTGSGKTTTLYACLNEINDPTRKIITIENPIEYEMEGITQIQVNPNIAFDFATGLRSVLRHDPDILMVGEVRDRETADIAIRTALTGHLVFSTLHTNDAASAVTRLVDMGVEPYLVASSVRAFVAQRLVRVICSHCKEEDSETLLDVRHEIAQSLGFASSQEIKIFKGRGCDHCNGTGYYGRTAIYEILDVNEDVRAVILEKPRAEEIKRIAVAHGMRTLRQDGWVNVVNGITTPAEVLNVTMKEESPYVQRSAKGISQSGRSSIGMGALKDGYMVEARGYPRLLRDMKVEYCIMDRDSAHPNILKPLAGLISATTRDVSASGFSFVLPQKLSIGALVGARIHIDDGRDPVSCLTRVIRVEEYKNDQFLIALFYLDMAPKDRQRMIQRLHQVN
ncbi:MAG: Flp pilus assembly complex ATPase component TadA [Candidatus Omnitrophica bacterium]|nr:Flp pilus assembly complex ATPase component TadA [Candidatus Omnitrophota bacterium]